MLQKKGVAITFNAFFTASQVGATGLTVTVDVYEGTTKIVDNEGATENAGGLYYYTLSAGSVDANADYIAVFKTAGTADQKHVAGMVGTPTFIDNLDAPISTVDTVVDSILTAIGTIDDYLDTEIAAILAAVDTEVAAIKAKTDNIPAAPATEAKQDTIIGYLDTEVAAILAAVDTEIASIKGVTDKVDTMLELDGAVYRLTLSALELAPTGGSAPTAAAIRAEIDANSTQLAAIAADTAELQANQGNWLTAVGFSTHSAADVWAVTTRTLSSFGTLIADFWTNATRSLTDKAGFTISGTKTTLDALNDLSSAQAQAAATASLNAYDPPTRTELTSDKAEIIVAVDANEAKIDLIKTTTDKLDDTLELDTTVYRFTENALEQAPSGGAGGGDATEANQDIIIAALSGITTAVTSSNAVIVAAGRADEINIRIADTFSQAFTSLGAVTGYTKIWFTAKADRNQADSEALVQIVTTTGLLTLNGATGTAANGSITVTDAATGNLTVLLDEVETAKLSERSGCYYNIKALVSGVASTLAEGRVNIIHSTTKAIS